MRASRLLLGTLLLGACNSILGNTDHHLVDATGGADAGPKKCRLNSNCAADEICLFQMCGPACDGDRDCAKGARCLQTDTGTACVTSSAATCEAGCPAGTTCSPTDGVCRNSCETTECLKDQTCTNRLCVGTDQHEGTSGGGGADGGGGSGAGGSGSSTAGAAGGPDADSCSGKVCNDPPEPSCKSAGELTSYDATGSCTDGVCNYQSHVTACDCHADVCVDDPCIGKLCNDPPANECKNTKTQTSYAASGTCTDGDCAYEATDKPCDSNQLCGGAGVCSVCKTNTSCGASCSACGVSTPVCKDLGTTSKCVACTSDDDCGSGKSCDTATNVCKSSSGQPSCSGLATTCGPNANADCCTANLVTGGAFNRSNDANFPATVANFRLDNFEVTVGRFRKFVGAYSQTMIAAGAGKNPNNASDTGWNTAWNASLAANQAALMVALNCDATYQTWHDAAGTAAAESLPINCVSWFEAQAFCIWDGGRLPTEAEWNYAAAGGVAQRTYPWGTDAPDCTYANYLNGDYCVSPGKGAVNRVGSESTKGDGLYGQSDLGGNLWEWAQDWYANYTKPCVNCAHMTTATGRVVRGNSFNYGASYLLTSARANEVPTAHKYIYGIRCARNP